MRKKTPPRRRLPDKFPHADPPRPLSERFPDTRTLTAREEMEQLKKRLSYLEDAAENEIRGKLREARAEVTRLEMELASVTGRPTAMAIKASKGLTPLTDEDLEVQIVFLLKMEGGERGMNGKTIASRLNQDAMRVRDWLARHPHLVQRQGKGPGTKFLFIHQPN